MPGWMTKLIQRPKSIQEIEEETERAEAEDRLAGVQLSLEEKRMATKMLKERGLSPQHFGDTRDAGTWQKVLTWLKTH